MRRGHDKETGRLERLGVCSRKVRVCVRIRVSGIMSSLTNALDSASNGSTGLVS